MKRQSNDTEALVYAYGCGEPTTGLDRALAEAGRCSILWDRLVAIERIYEREIEDAARADNPSLDGLLRTIADLSVALAQANGDNARKKRLIAERMAARKATWPLLSMWRNANSGVMRDTEKRRRNLVILARQHAAETMYWGNYNAVLARYETARRAVWQKGRRLREADLEREDGCLTVQIQRTRSGLGAAPSELQDGTCSALAIGAVPDSAFDPYVPRGERDRLIQTEVEMRVDHAGNTIRLPLWLHRPLPADGRVKQAQLTWRRDGRRIRYQLCLTISRPKLVVPHTGTRTATVRVGIAKERDALIVAHVEDSASAVERIELSPRWMRLMDRVEHLAAMIGDETASAHARILARLERPGLSARLLRNRREHYRLTARRLAMTYRVLTVQTHALSEVAYTDAGQDANALRHRACAHSLVSELQHQGRKHGCVVTVDIAERDTSAPVPRRVRRKRINSL